MHSPRPAITAWLFLLLPMLISIGALFHGTLRHPNSTFFGQQEDALKNYYTPWYHAKHDSSWHWFEGMNYPYGDHIIFADAQPLLSNAIRAVGKVAPAVPDQTVAIMNLLMLAQILVAGYCLWRILLRWQVEAHFAALGAAAIALLSPQLLRMTGHYALSYAFLLPLLWLLLLRAQERPQALREGLVGLCLFLAAWLHPYYLMIGGIFLTCMQALHLFSGTGKSAWRVHLRSFVLQVLLPGLLFFALLKLTDPVTDRPANPSGIATYIATWRSICLPIANPLFDTWTQPLLSPGDKTWEGIAYIGLSGSIGLLLLLPATALRLLRHRRSGWRQALRRSLPSRHRHIGLAVAAALLLLAFSMGFPFAIKPDLLTDLFPPIKQFRSLGRFAWLFYTLWMVYLVYALYRLHRLWRGRRRVLAYLLPGIALLSLFGEGIGHLYGVRLKQSTTVPAMAAGQPIPWLDGIPTSGYAALLALPWFHAGGENMVTTDFRNCGAAFAASLRTGLPLLNVMMSRTSVSQTWDQFQLATEPAQPLALLAKLTDPRPLLAMRSGLRDTFDGAYFRFGMPPGSALADGPQCYALDLRAAAAALLPPVADTLADTQRTVGHVRRSFDQDGDAPGIYATQGKRLRLRDNNFLYQDKLPQLIPNTPYTISLWAQIREDGLPLTKFGVEVHDAQGATLLWSYPTLNGFVRRIEGDWALCERQVTIADPSHRLSVNITRWSRSPEAIVVDELSIHPSAETDMHRTAEGRLLRNNRFLQPHAASSAPTTPRIP
jgi:hypothetical protein